MKSIRKALFGILLFSIVILASCAYFSTFLTANLDLGYISESSKKSPLGAIPPMTIALQVEDQRDPNERDRVGGKKDTFGMAGAMLFSNKKATDVLYDALKNELMNNGHKTVDTKESHSDVPVYIYLKKYWSDFKDPLDFRGTVSAHITIANPRNDSALFSDLITGTFQQHGLSDTYKRTFERVLNGALEEFIRNFSRDSRIIKALQYIQQKKEGV